MTVKLTGLPINRGILEEYRLKLEAVSKLDGLTIPAGSTLADMGYDDPTNPIPLPESNLNGLMEELIFHKPITLEWDYLGLDLLEITLCKTYTGRVDEASKVFTTSDKTLREVLEFIQGGLHNLNRNEV